MKHSFKLAILLLLAVSVFFLSCKKDKPQAKQLWLSKVFRDGLLQHEYIYDAGKKPVRKNRYNAAGGQSVLFGFRLYQYNTDGLVSDITDFTASNQFSDKLSLVYDVNKRVTRLNQRNAGNAITYYYVLEYNAGGKLSKYTLYNQSNDEKMTDAQCTYNAGGVLSKIIRRSFIVANPVPLDSTNFVFNATLPAHWNYYEMIPVIGLPAGERTFFDMITNSSFNYRNDAPPQKTTNTFSNKNYNEDGYITGQTFSVKSEIAGPPTTTVFNMSYEYVQ